jgi:hypothetical protein
VVCSEIGFWSTFGVKIAKAQMLLIKHHASPSAVRFYPRYRGLPPRNRGCRNFSHFNYFTFFAYLGARRASRLHGRVCHCEHITAHMFFYVLRALINIKTLCFQRIIFRLFFACRSPNSLSTCLNVSR